MAAGVAVARRAPRRRRGCRSWSRNCPRPRSRASGRRRCPPGRRSAASCGTPSRCPGRGPSRSSSLTTSWGETELRRESPEPSTAWTSVPTEFANRSTASAPARRESRACRRRRRAASAASRRRSCSRARWSPRSAPRPRGEATSASGSRRARRRGGSARPTRPSTLTPCFRSASLIAAAATSSGSCGVVAAVVAVVEREARERAHVGAVVALAVEDRVVGEHPAGDPLDPGAGDRRGRGSRPGSRAGRARGRSAPCRTPGRRRRRSPGRPSRVESPAPGELRRRRRRGSAGAPAGPSSARKAAVVNSFSFEAGTRRSFASLPYSAPSPLASTSNDAGAAGAADVAHRLAERVAELRKRQGTL